MGTFLRFAAPTQHAQISPAEFAACMDKRPMVELTDLSVLESYRERATIPGTDVRAKTVAITVRFKAKRGSLTQTTTDTAHQIYAKGRWRFALDANQLEQCLAPRADA